MRGPRHRVEDVVGGALRAIRHFVKGVENVPVAQVARFPLAEKTGDEIVNRLNEFVMTHFGPRL